MGSGQEVEIRKRRNAVGYIGSFTGRCYLAVALFPSVSFQVGLMDLPPKSYRGLTPKLGSTRDYFEFKHFFPLLGIARSTAISVAPRETWRIGLLNPNRRTKMISTGGRPGGSGG